MNLIASLLRLDRKTVQKLRIYDAYALHRVIYSLFPDTRSMEEKQASIPSGFLYADNGGDFKHRHILLLSDREPVAELDGITLDLESKAVPPGFLEQSVYRFKVLINPTRRDSASRRLIPVKGREAIAKWFLERAEESWGFRPAASQLQVDSVNVLEFKDKNQRRVTMAQAKLQGVLEVTDQARFVRSFSQGIGRGRTFGCGLLQIKPIQTEVCD